MMAVHAENWGNEAFASKEISFWMSSRSMQLFNC